MRKSRLTDSRIIGILNEVEVGLKENELLSIEEKAEEIEALKNS